MEFVKYPHLERFGNDEVQGIEFGECWIFPKLDGANAQIWQIAPNQIGLGSRSRDLADGNDNQGFRGWFSSPYVNNSFYSLFEKYPQYRLYGEWLVPHAFRGYRDDAWRRFWIFDVTMQDGEGNEHFLSYDVYEPMLREFALDYVVPINRVTNPTEDVLLQFLNKATFLCKDGVGPGEGIVIKNYGFYNKFQRQTWAKIVRQEYKELHTKHHGVDKLKLTESPEEKIVERYVSKTLIGKELSKIPDWNSHKIPQLFGIVYHCLITEELWGALKEFKDPCINFKTLRALMIQRIKILKPELF